MHTQTADVRRDAYAVPQTAFWVLGAVWCGRGALYAYNLAFFIFIHFCMETMEIYI